MSIINKTFSVGPGIKHAILWISFIVTFLLGFGIGWYTASEHYRGDSAVKNVEILTDDSSFVKSSKDKENRLKANLEVSRENRQYDKKCADRTIADIISE